MSTEWTDEEWREYSEGWSNPISQYYYRQFMEKVGEPDEHGCRLWSGGCWPNGRARFYARRTWPAARWLMIYRNGGVDPGPDTPVSHSCKDHGTGRDILGCVAEEHLRFDTRSANTIDSIVAGTHNWLPQDDRFPVSDIVVSDEVGEGHHPPGNDDDDDVVIDPRYP